MKYLNILDCDIVDGNGIRVTLFVSGCPHHCKGCHNPESWDAFNGKEFTKETIDKLICLIDRALPAAISVNLLVLIGIHNLLKFNLQYINL